MRYYSFLLLSCFVFFISACSKGGSSGGSKPPENLVVTAVVNPDNSGNVSFTATATNAVSFDYDFGNGLGQSGTTGIVTYKYPISGNYTVKVFAKSADGQSISKSVSITVTVVLALVWSDEFDAPGLPNAAKWGYDLGDGCPNVCGWGNNELEWYTNRQENAVVQGGVLKITAIRENYNGKPFTSARLLTKDKFSFKYGKAEIRAKLPAGVGTWPAIWMLGSNIGTVGWPACGEIDIMEHRASELNKIFGTLHHPGHSGGNPDGSTVVISNATTEFHKYTVEWTPTNITFLVDDASFYIFTNSGALPFNQNFFFILNLAMGGNFAGAIDPALNTAVLEIDYIRVYQ